MTRAMADYDPGARVVSGRTLCRPRRSQIHPRGAGPHTEPSIPGRRPGGSRVGAPYGQPVEVNALLQEPGTLSDARSWATLRHRQDCAYKLAGTSVT